MKKGEEKRETVIIEVEKLLQVDFIQKPITKLGWQI